MNKKNVCSIILVIISGLVTVSYALSQELILPDSGQKLCYDWEKILCDEWHIEGFNQVCDSPPYCPEEGEDFYGQDATYSINPPDLANNNDGTITDNLVELTWEQKSETNETQLFTYAEALSYCENLDLGEKDEWRMPTRPEYSSILNSNFTSPALDRDFFPHYTSSDIASTVYWTTSKVHDDVSQAWIVQMSFGLIGKYSKILKGKIRCVNGDILPESNFIDNGDGTVTDTTTGLMWEQKTDDGSSRDMNIARTWNNSLQYCEALILGEYSDWRLPTTREQERIVDLEKTNPAADTQFFPNTQNALYWSGTSCAGCHKHKALSTDYTDGTVYFGYKKRIHPLKEGEKEYPENHDRCVRGGQCIDLDEDTVCDKFDNCPEIANPEQFDYDEDGAGNECDATPGCESCPEGEICINNICVIAGTVQIDKCKVNAGKKGKGDSLQFSGLLDVIEADFLAAMDDDVIVSIEADAIPDLYVTTFTFPIDEESLKKGKYKSPKIKPTDRADPVTSLQIDSIKGKMKFSGKNLDLTGLSCPITIIIQIGDYVAEAMLFEDIVNGPKKPCPPELMAAI